MNNEGFDYLGPTSFNDAPEEPVSGGLIKDENELGTLEKAEALIANRIAYYQAIDSIDLEDKNFDSDVQIAINKKVLFHLQELNLLITKGINDVKEHQNGR